MLSITYEHLNVTSIFQEYAHAGIQTYIFSTINMDINQSHQSLETAPSIYAESAKRYIHLLQALKSKRR